MKSNKNVLINIDKNVLKFYRELPELLHEVKICVTISAKNEERYIYKTLTALKNQIDVNGKLLNYNIFEIIVLCHNCTDSTFQVSQRFKENNPYVNLHILKLDSKVIDNIGSARRLLMNLSSLRLINSDGWIATTDADTIPQDDWLYQILEHPSYIDMVCGKIIINTEKLQDNVKHMYESKMLYQSMKAQLEFCINPNYLDPWPKHCNNSGPSLAVRKYAYLAVGGIDPIPFLEDVKLYQKVKSYGFIVVHSNDVKVETSTRISSRTDKGFGSELKKWTFNSEAYKVEDLKTLIKRYTIYQKIAELFDEYHINRIEIISQMSFVELEKLNEYYRNSSTYEELVFKVEEELDTLEKWRNTYPLKNIKEVLIELDNYLTVTI